MRKLISLLIIPAMVLSSCGTGEGSVSVSGEPDADLGRQTESLDKQAYSRIYYVSAVENSGDSDPEGTQADPLNSIRAAVELLSDISPQGLTAILVSAGSYTVNDLQLLPGLHLFGGFDPQTWERDVEDNSTVLSGANRGRVILGADNTRVDGFLITGGRHRADGGAIFCSGVKMEISNNLFTANTTLAPIPWKPRFIHEKAHDGGAVYGENGASLQIRNNVFWRNQTENGRGAAVAFHGNCEGEVHGNLFLDNKAGINDGHRSSDGGAVSVFDWCDVDGVHNLFSGNVALSKNDGGGLFYALWSSGSIRDNVFLNNQSMDDAGALFVGGQEHRYDIPLDPLPPADKFFVSIEGNVFMGNRNPSLNSGAFRITMESRGSFTNNLTAFNHGTYFQRSEMEIAHNTLVDNLLLIETKEGLKPGSLVNNIVLGEVDIETEVQMRDNLFPEELHGDGYSTLFLSDGQQLRVIGSMKGGNRMETRIVLDESLEKNALKHRIIRSGDHFALVKENRGSELVVYGDIPVEATVMLMPTYTPAPGSAAMVNQRNE